MSLARLKELSFDFITNILASMVVTIALQILIYPLIARSVSAEIYGLILIIMGIVNTIVMAFGGTLNNIRLIQNQSYEKKGIRGDFNLILLVICILGAISVSTLILFFQDIGLLNIILLIFIVVLGIIKSYYLVEFRLKLKFTFNLYCNLVIAIGYFFGLLLFYSTKIWMLPFLIGEIFACIFLLFTTKLAREPIKVTYIFKRTLKIYLLFIITGGMATALTYMDRLIIFPLLGGEAVSIFTVASFFGKSIGLVMTPIAGVLLGYYVQNDFKFTLKMFWSINTWVLIFSALFFCISCIGSSWFTGLLYPSLIERANSFIIIANLAAIIGIASSMTQPAVLNFAPMIWQVIIQLVYGIVYIALGIIMLYFHGISGFCVSIIVANIVKLILLYGVGHMYVKKGENT